MLKLGLVYVGVHIAYRWGTVLCIIDAARLLIDIKLTCNMTAMLEQHGGSARCPYRVIGDPSPRYHIVSWGYAGVHLII